MKKIKNIILVLVVVLIIAAILVFVYCYNKKNKNVENQSEENSQVEENVEEEKEDKYLDLDSKTARKIATILSANNYKYGYFFYDIDSEITINDLSNEDKEAIASYYMTYVDGRKVNSEPILSSVFDETIKKIFGNVEYSPSSFYGACGNYNYDSTANAFTLSGKEAGSPIAKVTGVYEIENNEDEYVAYSKLLLLYPSSTSYPAVMEVHSQNNRNSSVLDSYDENIGLRPIVEGVEERKFAKTIDNQPEHNNTLEEISNYHDKLLTKHFDSAQTYKHTFKKDSEGNFYWVKSEIVK